MRRLTKTLKDNLSGLIQKKFFKYNMFFILKTIQACFQAVAEKLLHATLKCQSNKEQITLFCLLRFIRYCEKGFSSVKGFI